MRNKDSKKTKSFWLKAKYSRGFTIIELLVTITFISILSTITVPNLFNMYERYLFRRDVYAVYDMILQARNNAISAKNCWFEDAEGDTFAESWEVRVVQKPEEDPPEYRIQLRCNLQGNDAGVAEADMIDDEIVLNEKKGIIVEDGPNAITGLQVFMDEQQTDEGIESYEVAGESATMHFFTDSVRAKIEELTEEAGVYNPTIKDGIKMRYDNFRVEFNHKDGWVKHTICINRISAFPLRYEDTAECDEI